MIPFSKTSRCCFTSAFTLIRAPAVFAQQPPDTGAATDNKDQRAQETITPTATRREAAVEKILFNFSAIGKEVLRKRNINKSQFDESSVTVNSGIFKTDGGGLSTDTDLVVNQPLGATAA
ncbi:hypothetical protein [Microbulbifer sp. TYP-18]|uniref:hypothetical protein n=1 Tax=Microbulbifer sp. TYP-18 TaxID=3230024 RepID=UPI0034C62934